MVDKLPVPIELTDAELDAVAAGQVTQNPIIAQGGLINIGANVGVGLDHVLNNFLNNNNVDVAVAVLGGSVA